MTSRAHTLYQIALFEGTRSTPVTKNQSFAAFCFKKTVYDPSTDWDCQCSDWQRTHRDPRIERPTYENYPKTGNTVTHTGPRKLTEDLGLRAFNNFKR